MSSRSSKPPVAQCHRDTRVADDATAIIVRKIYQCKILGEIEFSNSSDESIFTSRSTSACFKAFERSNYLTFYLRVLNAIVLCTEYLLNKWGFFYETLRSDTIWDLFQIKLFTKGTLVFFRIRKVLNSI